MVSCAHSKIIEEGIELGDLTTTRIRVPLVVYVKWGAERGCLEKGSIIASPGCFSPLRKYLENLGQTRVLDDRLFNNTL